MRIEEGDLRVWNLKMGTQIKKIAYDKGWFLLATDSLIKKKKNRRKKIREKREIHSDGMLPQISRIYTDYNGIKNPEWVGTALQMLRSETYILHVWY